ncbi:MAG: ferrous iron transport protein A [Clostridia bacterium]|nr:ferrous iron transport protein A [Clostridia bacterium]
MRHRRHQCGRYRVAGMPFSKDVCRSMSCYGIRPGADIQVHNVNKSGVILYVDGVRVAISHDVAKDLELCKKT